MRRALLTAMSGMMILTLFGGTVVADAPANDAFQNTWQRTDQPVLDGAVARTWMWGPEAFTSSLDEPYAESPNGQRTVQYFDKSRMEITNPDSDSNSIWYVTNGLLVVEMMTGQLQTGDSSFQDRSPAEINVAGDANDPTGPTYATFSGLRDAPPLPSGQAIMQRVSRSGNVSDDPSLAGQGIQPAFVDDVTNHAIAAPFWDFMNSSGTVYENGGLVTAPLFENAFFATGRPITEAYWAEVLVGGTPRDVLMQCFERRCLTYTPGNSEGFVVEAGNSGRHYHSWRYDGDDPGGGSGEEADLQCVAMGYPCSLADTPQLIIEQTFDYGETMVEMMESGSSMDDLLSWVLDQPGVAEARANDWVVRFRIDGGRPAWVYDSRTFHETSETASAANTQHLRTQSSSSPIRPNNVVGKDLNNDGMTDEKPKRALILSPFAWRFEPWDASDEIAALLQGTRGYDDEGNVQHFSNTAAGQQNVLVSHFAGWGTFDVVYISSHGGESCNSDDIFGCDSFINSGVPLTEETAANMEAVGGDPLFAGYLKTSSGYIGLSNEFFGSAYGQSGVDNTIVYIDSCHSFERMDLWDNAGTLPDLLAGLNSVVFGWERSVSADHSAESARLIFSSAIEDGTPVGKSFNAALGDIVNDGSDDARLHLTAGSDESTDLRIREIVTQLDPLTEEPLEDGDGVPIIGQLGDGNDDQIPIAIRVEGIDDDPAKFIVHVRVNDEDLAETFTLQEGEQVGGGLGDPVTGPRIYELTDKQASLGRDIQPGEQLKVMIWIELPEGGETKQTLSGPPKNPVLKFHSTITGTGDSGFVTESIVTAEMPLALNADLDGVEAKTYELKYESYEVSFDEVPCTFTSTLHSGTIRLVDAEFPKHPETGKLSPFVPNYVVLAPVNDITADLTIVCEGSPVILTLDGDIHWYAGFVVAYQGELDSGAGGFRFTDWEEGDDNVYAESTVIRSEGSAVIGELELEVAKP